MKRFYKLFSVIILSFSFLLSGNAGAQVFKVCNEGVKRCEPLLSDAEKYKECMQLVCYDYYFRDTRGKRKIFVESDSQSQKLITYVNVEEKPELIVACEYGRRKCSKFKDLEITYWLCVDNECKNEPAFYEPNCVRGQKLCSPELKSFNRCSRLNCFGLEDKEFADCQRSKRFCGPALSEYWSCVYKYCLGDVDKYYAIRTPEKKRLRLDFGSGKRKVIEARKAKAAVFGSSFYSVPDNINPDAWIRETAPEFMVRGNPANTMECPIPGAMLNCETSNLLSCYCSDGTMPIFKDGKPRPPKFDY